MAIEYPDRYIRASGWKGLRFIPGRGVQAAELNEVQSVLRDEMHQLGRTVWSDGQVVRGIELVVQGAVARLSAGQVYYAGVFHDFPGGVVAITSAGQEIIGLRFTARTLSEADAPELHDPSSGWENAGFAGAHRLVYDITVTRNDADAVPLYALQEGALSADYRPQPAASDLALIMARRTYDESGDYLVRGLRCRIEPRDAAQFWLVVGDGKAYVRGQEFSFASGARLPLDRPIEYQEIADEPKTYRTGTSLYPLNHGPVRSITGVTAVVEKTVSILRGAPNGADALPLTPVASIEAVAQGSTTYAAGTDYALSGDSISWSAGGAEPVSGSSYSVRLRYVKQMVAVVDYLLTGAALDFSPSGDNPVAESIVYVDYQSYLPRQDLLVLTARGELRLVRGAASVFGAAPPAPVDALPIATILLGANAAADAVAIKHSDRYRLTMAEIAALKSRIDDLEYNAAVSDLEQAAINVQLPTAKKAIFTDAFRDRSKMDAGAEGISCTVGAGGDCLDTLYPEFQIDFCDLSQDLRLTLRPFTSIEVASQDAVTDQINVNPYAAYSVAGVLDLSPANDLWTESATETVEQWGAFESTARALQSVGWLAQSRDAVTVTIRGSNFAPYADDLLLLFGGALTPWLPAGTTLAGTQPGSIRADSNGAFAATFTVPAGTPSGSYAVSVLNLDNSLGTAQYMIEGKLEHWVETVTRVQPQPAPVYYYGGPQGDSYTPISLYVSDLMYWPPELAYSELTLAYDWSPSDARAWVDQYAGTKCALNDPIAETFRAPYDHYLTRVGVRFAAKDAATPVAVSIRKTANGYPAQIILAEAVLTPDQVTVSTDGSALTVAEFAEPAYLRGGEDYAIVVATTSSAYVLHYARLGHQDRLTGEWVLSNPYAGVMFSSANALSWTADQSADLAFRLYRASFGTAERLVELGTVPVDGSQITIVGGSLAPAGTEIAWEVQWDGAGEWQRVPAGVMVDAGRMLTSLAVRARLRGTDALSPALIGHTGVVVTKWAATGRYISRTVTLAPYTDLRLYVDVAVPDGTEVTPYYSRDGGSTWTAMSAPVSTTQVNDEFVERAYAALGLSAAATLKIRLDLTSSAGRLTVPRVRRLRAIAT